MINVKTVSYINGIFLNILAAGMIIPILIDWASQNEDWKIFAAACALTAVAGVMFMIAGQQKKHQLQVKEGFLLITSAWILVAIFGALPFVLGNMNMSYVDAFFETMSGITTTGATVIDHLNHAPPGILWWRAFLQWFGGIGIVLMAVTVLPMLQVGGMQLFRMEFASTTERVLPRSGQIAMGLLSVYAALTAICALLLWKAGMTGFDALAHAMTTMATGGYSTVDESIAFYNNPRIEWILTGFMILASLPFLLYLQAMLGNVKALFKDTQVRAFMFIVALAIMILALYLHQYKYLDMDNAVRLSAFNVVSLITGTGFASDDYNNWGGFASVYLLFLMFIGGCAGSTAGGIKIFRFQILYETMRTQIETYIRPHGVFVPKWNKKPITDDMTLSVTSFFFMYIITFVLISMILGYLGLDLITALSGAAATLSNVGPGLGDLIGPVGNYKMLPDAAKWVMSVAMLLGRLELFTILVLFAPHFWRR